MGPSQLREGLVDTPRHRAVAFFFCFTVMGIIWSWTAVLLLAYFQPWTIAPVVAYLSYTWTIGFNHSETMGSAPLRSWRLWRVLQEYFAGRLHKTAELDPKKTYLFAMAPHGITAISAWLNFGTEATGFSKLFPGIHVRCATLDANFRAPVIREYVLAHGLRSAGRRSLRNILSSGPGSAVLLVPGGAAEALLAAPGTCDVLAKHKGFVKVAMESGASIVPVVAFGECDLFDTYIPAPGSDMERTLWRLKKWLSISTPIFWGVGFRRGSWGLLPHSVPLNTVVGAPIEVPRYQAQGRGDERMAELVEEYHAKYRQAVQEIWDTYKDQYLPCRKRELRFVG